MKNFLWSLRREVWESRSIYVAPLAVAVVFLFGFVLSVIRLPHRIRAGSVMPYAQIAAPYDVAAGALMLTAIVVAIFYSLDALYGERRDRSTLFWKSLPVSDRVTVLAKAVIPIVILPLLAFVVTFALHVFTLLVSSAVLAASGQSVTAYWSRLSFFRMEGLLLYHLVAMHSLWHAPLYAWLLLVSAWARRAPFVWAVVPPLAIGFFEKIVFGSTHFAAVMQDRLGGGAGVAMPVGTFPTHPMAHVMLGDYLADPGLWIGFGVTALFLWMCVRLRRSRAAI